MDYKEIDTHLKNLNLDTEVFITQDMIKSQYRKLAMKYHPDRGIYKDGTMMSIINNSKDFLMDNIDLVNDYLNGELNIDEKEVYQDYEEEANQYYNGENNQNYEEHDSFERDRENKRQVHRIRIENWKIAFSIIYMLVFVSVAFVFAWYGSRVIKMDWMNWPKKLYETANNKWAYSELIKVDDILLIIQWVLQLLLIAITWIIWGIVWIILMLLCGIFYVIMYAFLPLIPYFILFGLGIGIYEIIADKLHIDKHKQNLFNIILLVLIGSAFIVMFLFCMI